ncbi:MAG: hypothetical protein A2W26_04865 [Acidobacteria bacterium RBG_16_64_8]|nr:MAG: hypothetical protein A2W26_04865 [Acidobacteria bacterium RBG_16_64_8]
MPCDSKTYTAITDVERLQRALTALGHQYSIRTSGRTTTITLTSGVGTYTRTGDNPFVTTHGGAVDVGRKYADLTVRDFAKAKNYAVVTQKDGRLTLTRRGY